MVALVPLTLDLVVPLNETRIRAPPRLMKYNLRKIENNIFFITTHGFIFDLIGIGMILGFDILLLNCAQHACALFQIVAYAVEIFLLILNFFSFFFSIISLACG